MRVALICFAILTITSTAFADCKWFKITGYTFGDTVPIVVSSDPGCFSLNGISASIHADGSVFIQLCNVSTPIACAGCGGGDVLISFTQPGLRPRYLRVRCQGCGSPFICCGYPTVDGCIGNICSTTDGDSFGTAIDVTACVLPLNEEQCADGIPAFLTGIDDNAGDFFGGSVALTADATRAVVGAIGDDDAANLSGAAYVFRREGAAWVSEAKLLASDGAASDRFGRSVSISGDRAVIGAYGLVDGVTRAGSAYIFRRIGTNWYEEAKLTASDPTDFADFGFAVSIEADVAVIGDPSGNSPVAQSGAAYVFRRTGSNWVQEAKLTASDAVLDAFFGWSVSISDDVIVIGADNGSQQGAYVFVRPPTGWVDMTETAKLTASSGVDEQFGFSVSISDSVVVVGATEYLTSKGVAYVFERPGSGWISMTETARLFAVGGAQSDRFGQSVSIDGDSIVVGGPRSYGNDFNSGAAYLFQKPLGGWVDMSDTPEFWDVTGIDDDRFGTAVAIQGGTTIIGAPEDGHSGAIVAGSVFVFTGYGDQDCDSNGIGDGCDILHDPSLDCNGNGMLDVCDIVSGTSGDCNGDEIPDECQVVFPFSAESLQLNVIGDGSPRSLTIPGALPAAGDVTLSFTARGDFGAPTEYVDVDINGVSVGSVFVTAGDCTVPYDLDEIIISAATYNSALTGPDAVINMTASVAVDPAPVLCASFIAVNVSYQAILDTDANADGRVDVCEPPCPGDSDGSGAVNVTDLLALLAAWGPCSAPCPPDNNEDGSVNVTDLLALLAAWGACQ